MKKTVLLGFMALLLHACILQSEFALPEKEHIDTALLGQWKMENTEGEVRFVKKTKTRYDIMFSAPNTFFDRMEAYVVVFGKHKVLNIISFSEEKSYNAFVEYWITDKGFVYQEVSDVDVSEFKNESDLLQHFENNIDRPHFLSEEKIVFTKL